MADPIRVSVYFDTQGQPALERGAEGVSRLTRRISDLARAADTLPRAMRLAESHLNSFGSLALRVSNQGITTLANRVDALYSTITRFGRYGLFALTAGAVTATLALKNLAKEFFSINEKFANLEISVSSAFASRTIGRQLREQLKQITVTSPLPFQDLAFATRSLSLIPQLNRPVGRQAANGTLGDNKGFFRQYIQLVEQLLVWRPDKAVEDATFAIREAATGELRSLIRRFDFPAQLLVNASGRSVEELKRDPQAMVKAIKDSLDKVISPQALRQIALQPTRLFQNIVEQLKDIPLLEIGDAGLYEKILRSLENFFNKATKFISTSFAPYAKRISDSFSDLFDSFIDAGSRSISGLAKMFGLNSPNLAGLTTLEKASEIVALASRSLADNAPKVFDRVATLAEKITPLFLGIIQGIEKVVLFLGGLFERSPIATSLTVFLTSQLPHLFRFTATSISDYLIKVVQSAKLSLLSPAFMSSSSATSMGGITSGSAYTQVGGRSIAGGRTITTFPNTLQNFIGYNRNVQSILRAGGTFDPNNPNNLLMPVPNVLRFSGVTGSHLNVSPYSGFSNAAAAAYFAGAGAGRIGGFAPLQSNTVNLPGPLADARNRRLLAQAGIGVSQYGTWQYAANNPYGMPAGRFASSAMVPPEVLERTKLAQEYAYARANSPSMSGRLGAGAAGMALSAGMGAATAGVVGSGVTSIAAIASSIVLPMLVIAAASSVLYTIVDKVRDYTNKKTLERREVFAKSVGLTEDSLNTQLRGFESSQNYFSELRRNGALNRASLKLFRPTTSTVLDPTSSAFSGELQTRDVNSIESFYAPLLETSSYIGGLKEDIDSLSRQILNKTSADFTTFKLKSNPALKVTAENSEAIYKLLQDAAARSEEAIKALEQSLSGQYGKREQVLTPSQASIFSRLEDMQRTVTGSSMFPTLTGETATIFDETTKRNKQVPTPFSLLASRYGASKESEEAARLTQDASDALHRLAVEENPFIEFEKVYVEDIKRVEEIFAIQKELNAGGFVIGTDTADRLEALVNEARENKIEFDYSKLESTIKDLRLGAGSVAALSVIKEFNERLDASLISGLSNRTTQFLSVFADTSEGIFNAKDSSSFNRLTRNLNSQFGSYVGQLGTRGLLGLGNADGLASRFSDLTSQLQPEGNVLPEMVNTVRDSNARIMQLIMDLVDSTISNIPINGDKSALLIDNEKKAVKDMIQRLVSKVVLFSAEAISEFTNQTNQGLSDSFLSGNFSTSTRGQAMLMGMQAGAFKSNSRLRTLGLALPSPDLSALAGNAEGDANLVGRHRALSEVLFANQAIIDQLEPRLAKLTDSQGKFTASSETDKLVLEEYQKAVLNVASAMSKLNAEMDSSTQHDSFMKLFSPRDIRNNYDSELLARQLSQGGEFSALFGGTAPSLSLSANVSGQGQTTKHLQQLNAIETAAASNATAFNALAQEMQAAGNAAQSDKYRNMSSAMLELAANARAAKDAITGNGGITSSFADGFLETTNRWKEMAQNFTEIGRSMATNISDSLGNALTNVALNTESASQAFANFGKSVLQMATQMMMQKSMQTLFGFVFSGFGGPAGVAAGAGFNAMSPGYVGGRADGGLIPGQHVGRDNLIAHVASGEYVIPYKAVQKFGASHFDYYRRGELPPSVGGYYDGGLVARMPSYYTGGQVSSGSFPAVGQVSVSVTINKDDGTHSSELSQAGKAEEFGRVIKAAVDEAVLTHLRQGGAIKRAISR